MNDIPQNRIELKRFIKNTIPLTEEAAENIASHFKHLWIPKGKLLLETGKVSDTYLFLETGFLRSYLHDTEGNEVTINFFSENSVVFEVSSFFQRVRAEETIEALTDSTGWSLSFQELNHLFHTIPEFRELGRMLLVKGFISFKKRTLSLINKTAEERYTSLMEESPAILQYAPLKHVASYLGITDTSLSRIRREYAKK